MATWNEYREQQNEKLRQWQEQNMAAEEMTVENAVLLLLQYDCGRSREGRPLGLEDMDKVEKARQIVAKAAEWVLSRG